MRIKLIAVGKGMPPWIIEGFEDYARRLPAECRLELFEVVAQRRGKRPNIVQVLRDEGARLLTAVPKGAWTVALDETGQAWSTRELARWLERWMGEETDVAMLVGGPDGLDPACRTQVRHVWSLSALTLPHMLVRVMVAEQIYRAWSIVTGHPYHRG